MLGLYYGPGACSMASHIVLEDCGEKYEPIKMDLAKGEQRTDAYLKMNPLGRVPLLQLDNGDPLAENTAKGARKQLYQTMGGQKGTNMDFKEFRAWYDSQSKAIGGDLSSYLSFSGLQAGSLSAAQKAMQKGGGGATGGALPFTAGSDILQDRGAKTLSDEGELFWINRQLGTKFSSLAEAQNALALPAATRRLGRR